MSLWAISGAPLIGGAGITKLNQADLEILTTPRVVGEMLDLLIGEHVAKREPHTDL